MGTTNPIKDFSIRNTKNFENSEGYPGLKLETNMSKVRSAGASPVSSPGKLNLVIK